MERKTNTEDTRPLWKRKEDQVGKLYLRTPGMDPDRRIKPGQTIRATVKQLGTAIHQFELLDKDADIDVEAETAKMTGKAPSSTTEQYTIVSKAGGWFDVVSPEGVKMNEKGLKAEAAEALKEQLEAEQPES